MTKLRITVLVDNTAAGHGLLAEHGLAMWIQAGAQRILFDTGQTDVLCHNAARLGIDLSTADSIVLSHGHYDHTGGLEAVLRNGDRMKVFVPPRALADKYARRQDGTGRYIGVPAGTREAIGQTAVVIPTGEPTAVGGGVSVTGPVPRVTQFEDTGGEFFRDELCTQPDRLVDDQAAFVDTPDGMVVMVGCAHAGLVNTLRYILRLVPARPIHTVIGGTHLGSADEKRMALTVETLRELDVQRIYPIHCTGFKAAARLWQEFPDRVALCPVGGTVEA